MNRICISLSLGMTLLMVSGCSKKVTKVENQLPPKEIKQEITAPADNNEFKEVDRTQSVLVPIYFQYDSYTLTSESIGSLEKIGRYLQQNVAVRLRAEGHCDERGSSEYNMGLGENRAQAVRKWLTAFGIEQSRIDVTSYGKERPSTFNCSNDNCHAQNRRVEWNTLPSSMYSYQN